MFYRTFLNNRVFYQEYTCLYSSKIPPANQTQEGSLNLHMQFSTWNLYLWYRIQSRHNKGTLQRSVPKIKSRICKIWHRDKSHFPKITIHDLYSLVHTEAEQFVCFRSFTRWEREHLLSTSDSRNYVRTLSEIWMQTFIYVWRNVRDIKNWFDI